MYEQLGSPGCFVRAIGYLTLTLDVVLEVLRLACDRFVAHVSSGPRLDPAESA